MICGVVYLLRIFKMFHGLMNNPGIAIGLYVFPQCIRITGVWVDTGLILILYVLLYSWAGIARSVQRLATGWTVRGSNPGGGARFSAPVQTGPGVHPASYTLGTYLLSLW